MTTGADFRACPKGGFRSGVLLSDKFFFVKIFQKVIKLLL